jgi:drug/metabolite transporter (DMT)-like permease
MLTTTAMVAFAANSLLCRLALAPGLIDPASFASLRVASGAVTLTLIALPEWRHARALGIDPKAVVSLAIYMVCFTFAYVSLAAGTGALILFGAVQLTMFVAALRAGEPFPGLAWLGLGIAMAGLVYLVSPGLMAPEPIGAVLMAVAGIAWGRYSLRGRHAPNALVATASNFVLTLPVVAVVSVVMHDAAHITAAGAGFALASGIVASGLGYVMWFAALRHLRATTAATVQLSAPVIAALGGVTLLNEAVTLRLVVASLATLGGIWLVLAQRAKAG